MKKVLLFSFSLSAILPFSAMAQNSDNTWIDKQHQKVKTTLHSWSNNINEWFGEPDPNDPASASLRVMLDSDWNRYDGFSIKPRVRGKIKLPVLKEHLNLVFGDDSLDNEARDQNRIGKNYRHLDHNRRYNTKEIRNDNASVALRWSTGLKELGIDTDFDIGIRSGNDIYGRFRIGKTWQFTQDFSTRLEQVYRYGSDSKHYLRTNLENKYQDSDKAFIMNHTFFQYTHDGEEERSWGHSLYRQHHFSGNRKLNYGLFVTGKLNSDLHRVNSWGPFVSYRQPVLRKWFFIQPEINFYNNRDEDRKHNVGAFLRLEAIF